MEFFLYIVFFVSCLVLVIAVLLQPGKTDAGALFTSGVSSAALNPRGTQSVLSKITIGAATVFMLSALMLSLPAITGDRSVLDTQGSEEKSTVDANANANTNANPLPATNANSGGAAVPADQSKPASQETGKQPDSKDEAKSGEADNKKEAK